MTAYRTSSERAFALSLRRSSVLFSPLRAGSVNPVPYILLNYSTRQLGRLRVGSACTAPECVQLGWLGSGLLALQRRWTAWTVLYCTVHVNVHTLSSISKV